MWLQRKIYERLVSEAALACMVPKLELRAEEAERALIKEREDRISEVRHVLSMFLRRMQTYPLPATADEKAEKYAEQQQRESQPPKLTPDQQARLNAAVAWGKQNGFTEEEARESFMAQLTMQVDDQ